MESTITFGKPKSVNLSQTTIWCLAAFFAISIIGTGLLVFHFASCNYLSPPQNSTYETDCRNSESLHTGDESEGTTQNTELSLNADRTTDKKENKENHRLDKNIRPEFYDLYIVTNLTKSTFYGNVSIRIAVDKDVTSVTLHCMDLKLHKVSALDGLYNVPIEVVHVRNNSDTQTITLEFSRVLIQRMKYILKIEFSGILEENLAGYYRSSYVADGEKRWIAVTQFEPTAARFAFPCFDEPAMKAEFQITLGHEINKTVLSNMPLDYTEPFEHNNLYVWSHFKRSLPMSTYLVAYTVCDFASVRHDGYPEFRVWTRKDALSQAQFSLSIGPKILKFFEDFFKIDFPLPKVDMIAIPDFYYGAMENWGLITYREVTLLFETGVTSIDYQLAIAFVVSHELAHQWFGNLVTPTWWSDVWLNEGFASYMEYLGTDAVKPDWKVMDLFLSNNVHSTYAVDALESSHQISTEVNNPKEIDAIFDSISYNKGSAVIRMMDHFLTRDVFRLGLMNYLNNRKYSNAEQDDLWSALNSEAHKAGVLQSATVKEIMDTWTLQTGFPVVTVTRDYSSDRIHFKQERFMYTMAKNKTYHPLWWIPITMTSKEDRNFSNTKPLAWLRKIPETTLTNIRHNPSDWVIVNVQETGFYRVNYDPENWKLLAEAIKEKGSSNVLPAASRSQIIDDALNLARAGRLSYGIALNITQYLRHENEFVPWRTALTALDYVENLFVRTSSYDLLRAYLLYIIDPTYTKLGFFAKENEPLSDSVLRGLIVKWACHLGNIDCIRNSTALFYNWISSPNPETYNPIPPNIRHAVYCSAIAYGTQTEWDFVFDRFNKTNVSSEKETLLSSLTCSRDVWLVKKLLDKTLASSEVRKQDYNSIFSALQRNVNVQNLLFDFFEENIEKSLKNHLSPSAMKDLLFSSCSAMSSQKEYDRLKQFLNEHSKSLKQTKWVMEQSLDKVETNMIWKKQNFKAIVSWLRLQEYPSQ